MTLQDKIDAGKALLALERAEERDRNQRMNDSIRAMARQVLGKPEPQAQREWCNFTEVEREAVGALEQMGAKSEATGKKIGDIMTLMQLGGVDYLTAEKVKDAITAEGMHGIVCFGGKNRGRRYWLSDISPIKPQ